MSDSPDAAVAAAHRFAAALDAGDWTGATACLAADCEYLFRGTTTHGRDQIIGSYRKIGEWVATTFDAVRYESVVQAIDGGRAEIAFRDLIDHGDHHLDFRCIQILTVGPDGAVARIEHVDVPGEPEKAERFNAACGVQKP